MEIPNSDIIVVHQGQEVPKKEVRGEISMDSIFMGIGSIVIIKLSYFPPSSSFTRAVAKEAYIYIFESIGEDRRVEERRGDIVRD